MVPGEITAQWTAETLEGRSQGPIRLGQKWGTGGPNWSAELFAGIFFSIIHSPTESTASQFPSPVSKPWSPKPPLSRPLQGLEFQFPRPKGNHLPGETARAERLRGRVGSRSVLNGGQEANASTEG